MAQVLKRLKSALDPWRRLPCQRELLVSLKSLIVQRWALCSPCQFNSWLLCHIVVETMNESNHLRFAPFLAHCEAFKPNLSWALLRLPSLYFLYPNQLCAAVNNPIWNTTSNFFMKLFNGPHMHLLSNTQIVNEHYLSLLQESPI